MRTPLRRPPFRSLTTFLLLCSAALLACGGGADAAADGGSEAPASPGARSCPGFSTSEWLAAVNAARAQARQCGGASVPAVAALSWSGALATAAGRHSSDMAARNFFSHSGSDGSDVGQRVSAAGYGWTGVGENIAAGPASLSAVMSGWLASPGHCANIMGGAHRDVGVACVASSGGAYPRYWTMVLARP